jgi:hypothetical protein
VTNRSQRSWLSRVRTSAHSLGIERGRYSNVPLAERYCVYCGPQHDGGGEAGDGHGEGAIQAQREVDSEIHFLARCTRFKFKRACFLKRLQCIVPAVSTMSELDLVKTILCPATPQAAKLADKFLGIMFRARTDIDDGNTLPEYPSWEPNQPNPFATYDFQNDEQSHHLDECDATTFSSDEDSLLS